MNNVWGFTCGGEELLDVTRRAMVEERREELHEMSAEDLRDLFYITVDLFGWSASMEFFEREGLAL